MRARFGVGRKTAVARFGDGGQRLGRRQVHDVQWGVGQFGQPNGAVGRLAFHQRGASEGMILWVRLAPGDRLLDQHLNHRAVLGVDADHAAVGSGDAHGFEQRRVVDHQHARIGREQLEARHSFPLDERLHVGERFGGDVEDDHVGGDVHARALRPPVPVVEPGA